MQPSWSVVWCYTAGAGQVALVLVFSVWLNQFLAYRLAAGGGIMRPWLLATGIALNLAGLVFYKYTVFGWHLVETLSGASLGAAPVIILPIGISFFTFQAISYLVDVYRREFPPATGYFDFAVYHTLFPQLVAGPIVRYGEVRDALHHRSLDMPRITQGAYRFCLGFGKKIVLADNLGTVTDQIMHLPASELTCGHAWLGIVCYTLQIYYDFSGYSDMAIGLGKLLGFDFPENFDQPYRSASITEFWRRWHMTLSRWFRDYVYIPLGGNRRGRVRTYVNLWVVFALCGLWHGAGINFLVWGLYYGFLLVAERLADRHFGWRPRGTPAVAASLLLVMIGWVFFRIDDLGTAWAYLLTMFLFGSADHNYFPMSHFLTPDIIVYLLAGVFFALAPIEKMATLQTSRIKLFAGQLGFGILSFSMATLQLASNSFNPFIYFRF
jgi:alginate O-acetyltransferase complex protein AlgI